MRRRTYISFALIILLAILSGWLALTNPRIQIGDFVREIRVHPGLDLQGGLRVLLKAELPPGTPVSEDSMRVAKEIIEKRVNALGVVEPLIQVQGGNRIVVELPGIENPEEAIEVFGSTGLLEFVDAGSTPLAEGMTVVTTGVSPTNSCSGVVAQAASPTPAPTLAPSATITSTGTVTETSPIAATKVYTTVMTGDCLQSAVVTFDPNTNAPQISFTLRGEGVKIFGDFTSANVGKFLAIVLDKRVLSSPSIESPITGGQGVITGRFTVPQANGLAVQLNYGALPVPLRIETTTNIGPTLGQDSVNRSIVAGAIGVFVVALFMILYYRLPGFVAVIALVIYGLIVFSIYKVGIPGLFPFVTLTLPGIAGFVLSLGVAVDANILIFERTKEELRAGRTLTLAVENGFDRAWFSIRDSNISTLITCAILLWFGSNFGASIVAGFALTLSIGVFVSMFTAIVVTRTFLRIVLDLNPSWNLWWFGIGSRKRIDESVTSQSSA